MSLLGEILRTHPVISSNSIMRLFEKPFSFRFQIILQRVQAPSGGQLQIVLGSAYLICRKPSQSVPVGWREDR